MINTTHLIVLLLATGVHLFWLAPELSSASALEPRLIEEFDDVESQLSIYPSDSEETSGLEGSQLIFTDFCITTRDNVMGDIRRTTSQLATNIFSLFFKSFGKLGFGGPAMGQVAGATGDQQYQQSANAFVNEQHANQEAKVAVGEESDDDTQVEGQTEPVPRRGIFGSVMKALSATKNAVAANVRQTLSSIKSSIGLGAVTAVLKDSCDKVENFEKEMRKRFDDTALEMGGSPVANIESLNCVTTNRVLNLGNFCRMVMTAHEPLSKVLALAGGSFRK